MTNREKFKEVFGFDVNSNRFSVCLLFDTCELCPFWDKRDCTTEARSFWAKEYEEAADDR